MDLFKQRRFWAALIPVVVIVGETLGVPVTEGLLVETGDKVVAAASAALAAWSLFFPKE